VRSGYSSLKPNDESPNESFVPDEFDYNFIAEWTARTHVTVLEHTSNARWRTRVYYFVAPSVLNVIDFATARTAKTIVSYQSPYDSRAAGHNRSAQWYGVTRSRATVFRHFRLSFANGHRARAVVETSGITRENTSSRYVVARVVVFRINDRHKSMTIGTVRDIVITCIDTFDCSAGMDCVPARPPYTLLCRTMYTRVRDKFSFARVAYINVCCEASIRYIFGTEEDERGSHYATRINRILMRPE